MILKGGTNAEKSKSPNNFLDSCSLLPILKWQVIAPLQLCKKEQEGTCDFEGGLHREKNNRVPYIRGNGVKNNRVQELNKTCYYEGGLHRGKTNKKTVFWDSGELEKKHNTLYPISQISRFCYNILLI